MDLSELVIKLTVDKDQAEQDAEEASSGIGEKVKKGLGTVGKVVAGAVAVVGTAAVAIGKQSIEAYGEFEQLTGGIETLYGSSASAVEKMLANADEAWKTAGMSANEYMSTAIEGSAALINSLGGDADKAAELMDMSIQDMADNVNKMGTNMESIQNAYRGFSRGNFTMLDNLALGFAGTKEGMQQLLDKAQEISGIEYDISSYADIVEAIHVVQTEMGITGTTAEEASKTIQGSMSAAKAAWQNMLIGIADEDADFGKLVNDLTESIQTAADNLIPRIQTVLEGAISVIIPLAEKIIPMLLEVIITNLPLVVEGAVQLITTLIGGISDNLPMVLDAAGQIISTLLTGIIDAIPTLIPAVVEVVLAIVQKLSDPGTLTGLIDAAVAIISALIQGITDAIPQIVEAMPEIITNIVTGLTQAAPQLLTAGVDLMVQLIAGLIEAIPQIVAAIPEIITGMVTAFQESWPTIKETGVELLNMLWEGIQSAISTVVEGVGQIWTDIKTGAVEAWGNIKTEAVTAWETVKTSVIGKIDALKSGIRTRFEGIKQAISGKIDLIKGLFNFNWSFPSLKLPHITYTLVHVPILGDIPDPRTLHVEWYKKAYDNPYLFTQPTVVGNMGFGDGNGGEIVYGHKSLLNDIKTAMSDVFGGQDMTIVVQSVLDGKIIGESVTKYQRQQARAFG